MLSHYILWLNTFRHWLFWWKRVCIWRLKWFPWELDSPVEPALEHGCLPRWIFPCITAFLSAMTSASNQSKLTLPSCTRSWCLVCLCTNICTSSPSEPSLRLILLWNHGTTENRSWPSGSLLLRPRLQHAPWQREGMWGGFRETEGQPHDVSHSDPDRQEQALVRVQRCHHYRVPGQRSRLVNTSFICLSWFQSHSARRTTDLGPTSPQLMCNFS